MADVLTEEQLNILLSKLSQKQIDAMSEEEKQTTVQILQDMAKGDSSSYNEIKYRDYKEVPVDIITFLDDNRYLGKAWHDANGKSKLFPYWRRRLVEMFPDNLTTKYNNAIFTGARGLGKSEIAIAMCCYMLYRVMCLNNPREYYGLKPTEKIAFAFMNITQILVEDIGMSKFQNTVQMSPWFMERGTVKGRTTKVWNPPDYINIIIGSQSHNVIGQAILFCLDGDTIICTEQGEKKIKDCVDKSIKVYSIDNDGNIVLSNFCTVKPTITTDEEYQIELEDGSIIKCTSNHKLMLKDGTYKEAKDLTTDDELLSFKNLNISSIQKIKSITKVKLEEPKQYYDVINANPYNNFLTKTNRDYIVSHNCFFDEISFIRNNNIEAQKEIALNMINTAIGGMKTRFIKNGKNSSLLVLASSKRSDSSFLETYLKKKIESEGDNLFLVDEAVWKIQPKGTFSKEYFYVAVGNKYMTSLVIPDGEDPRTYKLKGYKVIRVPMSFKADFLDDIDRALCDFAGESSTDLSKYISGEVWARTIDENLHNPFRQEIIEVGNAIDDARQYSDFFDMDLVDKSMMKYPLYIHMDMSVAGDKTGIAGVWIKNKKIGKAGRDPSDELTYQLAFAVSIKAPKGHQVSFDKNRKFIYWLKSAGYKIDGTSTDSYQSVDTGQSLTARGYNYKQISVDRTEKVEDNYICKPYQYFKNCIYEGRFITFPDEELTEEIIDLERNINTGRIDHPIGGRKDISDAVCLRGDTKVCLFNKQEKSISELYEEYIKDKDEFKEFVMSYNTESNSIIPLPIKEVVNNGYREDLIELTFNDKTNYGYKLVCTPDHLLLTKNGEYIKAEDSLNVELMPFEYSFYPSSSSNNKVTKIERADSGEVYDIKLFDIHNFALSCGVFVHNCGALFNASQNAEQFAYDYGEELETLVKVNNSSSQYNQINKLTADFEEQLQNMFAPQYVKQQKEEENKKEKQENNRPANSLPRVIAVDGMLLEI